MKSKKALEMSFAWIFSIVVGAIILVFAIYAATQLISIGHKEISVKTAKQLSIIIDPMETGSESGIKTEIELERETRIFNDCNDDGFGRNDISVSEKSGFLQKWPEPTDSISINNKYIFSPEMLQGKKFKVVSFAFSAGFKVSDILLIIEKEKKYCFIETPDAIKEELEGLNIGNINFTLNAKSCEGEKICFSSDSGCDKNVIGICSGINCESEYDVGYVEEKGKKVYYYNSLLYAAVFSPAENYECNFKRLMNRLKELSLLYKDKISIMAKSGCSSTLSPDLISLANSASHADLKDIPFIYEQIKKIETANEAAGECQLF